MNRSTHLTTSMILIGSALLVGVPQEVLASSGSAHNAETLAYIGPGAGLGALSALLAVVGAILLGVIGLVLYPLHLLRNWFRRRQDAAVKRTPGANQSA